MSNKKNQFLFEACEIFKRVSSSKKIVILTGTHGVGKTTTVEVMKRNVKYLNMISFSSEIARDIRARGYAVGPDMVLSGASEYIRLYLLHITEASAPLVVFDRGLLDLYIYLNNCASPKLNQDELDIILDLLILEAGNQTTYVFTPIQFPLIDDGVRGGDPKFQRRISDSIEAMLCELGANRMTVQGDAYDRARTIAERFELPFKEIRGFAGLGDPPYSDS